MTRENFKDAPSLKTSPESTPSDVTAQSGLSIHSREFLDSLVENLPNMVFVKDAKDLRFVRFNRAGEELLGFSRDELIGKNDFDFFPEEQARFFIAKDRAVLAGTEALDIPEEHIHTRRKGERVLHTKKIPIFDQEGRPAFLLGISEDITEKIASDEQNFKLAAERVAREEAERALQLRNEFLSIASHELKTPITALKLQLQMAGRMVALGRMEALGPDRLAKVFEVSNKQINRLATLIEDLLDLSRIDAGKLTYAFEDVDLSEIVRDVVERYDEQLGGPSGLSLSLDEPAILKCDRFRMEQVVVNLLSNAMKYGDGKPFRISVKNDATGVSLVVEDQGIGIPKEQQPRIFDRFSRAVSYQSISGLGLGLYITKQIVDAHGGTISVESEPGHGSTFTVRFVRG